MVTMFCARASAMSAFAIALAIHGGAATTATAQAWPSRPVTMVVPLAAGSGLDIVGRFLAPRLSELLGQQVVVENVGGAGGMMGANRVAKAPPDGYQFLLGTVGTHAQNQTLYRHPPYNAMTDFAPVALIADQPIVLMARNDLPADGLRQFIAYAKANQAKMQYGSAGAGSAAHLACALLNAAAGINVTHIPYRGGAAAMQDLIAGRIDFQCPAAALAIPPIEAGLAKAVAILSRARSPRLPQLPTADEQGLAGFDAGIWYALFLPRDTPASIVEKLHAAAVATMQTPAVAERLNSVAADVVAPDRMSPEYLARFVASEIAKWAAPIKAAGLAPD